ncbi:GNAT family N-acetyltransferase [Streptomyces nigrescens]|uniref:GNAT family N-acetyltransferase n=1 Tax=Streptomyces nigrescens TaxID=1920 RepID=A0ABY7IYE0_STRNI|nr:GNAT family N-acetyltransferase [Streptomyces nigrescens]WAU04019.1 GNAT family N-acetyltransferase [Streptomyces nigrescens]
MLDHVRLDQDSGLAFCERLEEHGVAQPEPGPRYVVEASEAPCGAAGRRHGKAMLHTGWKCLTAAWPAPAWDGTSTPERALAQAPKRVAATGATAQDGDVIQIRTASSGDVALLAILNHVVHDLHKRHRPDLFLESPEPDAVEVFFRAQIADPSVTVLLAGGTEGQPLGYALARIKNRPGSALTHSDVIVSLDQIAVVPDAARGGVGAALLEAVREVGRAAGCRRVVTDVWYFNEGARAFYQAAGFNPMNVLLEQLL